MNEYKIIVRNKAGEVIGEYEPDDLIDIEPGCTIEEFEVSGL